MKFSGIADEAGKEIDVQIKAHKELGWSDIEIRGTDDGTNLTDVTDEVFETIYGKVTDAGMTVSSFASGLCNWARPITNDFQVDIDELTRAIPRMQKFGSKYIRIMSYPNAKEEPWEEDAWRDEVLRRLKELTKMAEDGGIVLAHENCNGWAGESPENTLAMLEAIDSPAMTLIFDTGNPVCHEGQDSWEFYSKVKDHVKHIHIKDHDGGERHTYPGEGKGAVKEVVADLKAGGYDGYLSIEPHLKSVIHLAKDADDPEAAYSAYIKYGQILMDIVAKA
jgi:sugar phosphate isomerase/epimerase